MGYLAYPFFIKQHNIANQNLHNYSVKQNQIVLIVILCVLFSLETDFCFARIYVHISLYIILTHSYKVIFLYMINEKLDIKFHCFIALHKA